jgi:hypothetical protein
MLLNRSHTDPSNHLNDNIDDKMENMQSFESDAKKIVRRHLEDKDHVITEEEIASIRVGMTPGTFEDDKA